MSADTAKASEAARGRCACGAVRFRLRFPTRFVSHCHCENCRRAHGAAFVTWAGVPDEQFELEDPERLLTRWCTDTEATRSFCGDCGTTLLYEGPRWAGEVHIARANFDGAVDRDPGAHVYVDHAADWAGPLGDLPRFGGTTGTERQN